jgi:hypothetical protein
MERETLRPPARSEPTVRELEDALHIDTLDLLSADADQPELFYRVAKLLAALRAEQDAMKLNLEEAKARATLAARQAADETKTKITVGEMDAIVRLDPAVQRASADLQAVGQQLGEVTALKEAYSQRKSSLTDLVELQRQAGAAIDPAVVKQGLGEKRSGYRYQHGRSSHVQY